MYFTPGNLEHCNASATEMQMGGGASSSRKLFSIKFADLLRCLWLFDMLAESVLHWCSFLLVIMGNRLCRRCRNTADNSQKDGPKTSDRDGPGKNVYTTQIPEPSPPPTPQPTPPFPDNRAKVVVAVYSYTARTDDDLSFEKDDLLEIRDDTGDWWYARDRKLGKKGYIPCNYVVPVQSLEAEP